MNSRPQLRGTFGMVASTHYLATAAGMAVLEAGGNAVDAAVAAGFTLQVVEPHLNGPGGDMTLLFAASGADAQVLCGQGPAPAGATIDHYKGLGLDLVPGSGLLAAATPGSVPAWLTLLRDHGTRSLPDVLRFAVHYADAGVPVLPSISLTIASVADLFRTDWTSSAEIYLPGGAAPAPGGILRNPTLASTYRRLLEEAVAVTGREAQIDAALQSWSQGFVAQEVDAFVRAPYRDSSGERHAGVLTGADLAHWHPTYERPVSAPFGDWTVHKAAAWTQGPVLLQQLRLIQELGVHPGGSPRFGSGHRHGSGKKVGSGSSLGSWTSAEQAELVHLATEVAKLAFADREAWYGDSAAVPLTELLADDYTAGRAAMVGPRACNDLRPGSPGGREPRLPSGFGVVGSHVGAGIGEPTVSRDGRSRGDTCHVDVVDRWGGMVAATPSGGWLQSSPVIGALGFPLGTRLQMTTLEPGLPASLMPGRRPRSTLSPSMAGRGGSVELAFGTPGGDQQDQWQFGFLLRLLLGPADLDLQRAIDGPSWHSTHFPSSFYPREAFPGQLVIEDRFSDPALAELAARGHQVQKAGDWALGRLCAVGRDAESGWLRAGADPRGSQAYAAGR